MIHINPASFGMYIKWICYKDNINDIYIDHIFVIWLIPDTNIRIIDTYIIQSCKINSFTIPS